MAGLAAIPPSQLTLPHAALLDQPAPLVHSPSHLRHLHLLHHRHRPRPPGPPLSHARKEVRQHGPVRSLACDRLSAADLYNKQNPASHTEVALTLASPTTSSDEDANSSAPASPAGPAPRVHSFSSMAIAAPDSPPDLSSSRSTNSLSSFRSSVLSDSTSPDVITHFEDISLDESKRDSYDLYANKDLRSRISIRQLHSAVGARKRNAHAVDTMRSVHTSQARLGSVERPPASDDKPLSITIQRPPRPGYRSSSSGGPHALASPRFADSRSPSPSKSLVIHTTLQRSSASIPGSTAHSFMAAQHLAGPYRRKTWAPGRKTVKQLEDEYHDSDEEVPEDAIIWNVPVSPLEPFTAASREPSPRRQSSQSSLSSATSPPATLPRFPTAPAPAATGPLTSASAPHLLPLPRSATMGSLPDDNSSDLLSLRERHQSWNNDLSDEAREVALAMEAHNYSRRQSTDSKKSTSSPWHSPPQSAVSRRQSNSSVASLPPLQRSNIMIDPLPISKEKEAVLTRTRPSWLPPKCQKEEKKHLKQWERMMAKAAEADKRKADLRLSEMEETNLDDASLSKLWEEQFLPNWDMCVAEPRVREMWWRGVNNKNRGEVWRRAIGNALQLTPTSYAAALKRARESKNSKQHKLIKEDAAKAFPQTGLFTQSSPLHASLVDVLMAHTAYRPDVPYSTASGISRIAALFLLHMTAEEAFIALANVLNRPLPLAYLTGERGGIERYTSLVLSTMKVKLPALHDHFLSSKVAPQQPPRPAADNESPHSGQSLDNLSPLSLAPAQYEAITSSLSPPTQPRPRTNSTRGGGSSPASSRAIPAEGLIQPMLSSLFALHLDDNVDALARLWDIYVFEGDKLLVRAFVGLCSLVESALYGTREEVLAVLGPAAATAGHWKSFAVADIIDAVREAGKVSGPRGRD